MVSGNFNTRKHNGVDTPKVNLLVVTNSGTFDPEDSIFPIIRHMAADPNVESIAIVDSKDNPGFFEEHDGDLSGMQVRYVDDQFSFENYSSYDLEAASVDDFNTGWFRMDAPHAGFDFGRLFKRIREHIKIPFFNDLENLMVYGSKGKLVDLQENFTGQVDGKTHHYIPKTEEVSSVEDVRAFHSDLGKDVIVVKSLYGNGGKEVRFVPRDAGAMDAIRAKYSDIPEELFLENDDELAEFIDHVGGDVVCQEFVNSRNGNDKVYDDRVIVTYDPDARRMVAKSAVRRVAGKSGEFRSNLSQGGDREYVELDERHHELAALLSDELLGAGILLAGFDVMYDHDDLDDQGRPKLKIAEINVRNVGGVYEAELVTGIPFTQIVADGHLRVMRTTLAMLETLKAHSVSPKQAPAFFKEHPDLLPVLD